MRPERDDFRLPPIEPAGWLNGPGPDVAALAGKVVLVDFWDYTCIHCIRTLPHMTEWARRYREAGLVVIGVHAPEFPFAAERQNVEAAVRSLGLRHPVALDGERAVWRAFRNRYLPARYLAGRDGLVRWFHFGEGAHVETEEALRAALAAPEGAPLPEPSLAMMPLTASGAVAVALEGAAGELCVPVTRELYLNTAHGRFGNGPVDFGDTGVEIFRDDGDHEPDRAYLGGRWQLDERAVEHRGVAEATIAVRYTAAEVNLVLTPPPTGPCRVLLEDAGGPLAVERRGPDVFSADGMAAVDVRAPRMYALVQDDHVGEGTLRIRLPAACEGLRAFAFTFMSRTWQGPRPFAGGAR